VPASPLNLFISYSHQDERLREELGKHLASMQRQGVIKAWHDRKISSGRDWAVSIDENLNSADIILLLISENFIASDYCYDQEMLQAMALHDTGQAKVIPIILKPVDWTGAPFAKLQALPRNAKAVTTWTNRGEAYLDIVKGIKETARIICEANAQQPPVVGEVPKKPEGSIMPAGVQPSGGGHSLPLDSEITLVEVGGAPYVVRTRDEERCKSEIGKPGMLIRIKSPEKMGKSMMMGRILNFASTQGYRTAKIDLREANQEIFADINKFLKWLCAYVADQLNIDVSPEDTWKDFLGANPNATKYFEKQVLAASEQPLVMAIDNFDCIFADPNIETDFCGLLRGWFEKTNTSAAWGKLRQIIVYSQEAYAIRDINQSPFNIGFSIELGELDPHHLAALARAYSLSGWSEKDTQALMGMIGGNPNLINIALDSLSNQGVTIEELLRTAPTEEGVYGDFLAERLQNLERNQILYEAMKKVVESDQPVRLGSKEAFKLDSMGLIKRQGNDIVPRCNLYRLYFRDRMR
jgi:hypothetical protein